MLPLHPSSPVVAHPPEAPDIHPDDPLDSALQRMGEAGVSEIPVVSRAGGALIGVLRSQDAFGAYQKLASSKEQERTAAVSAQNWLPAVAAITVAAVLIISGLVFWQRTRRSDMGAEAYKNGEKLLAQGQVEEAVSAFRNALAHAPQDVKSRAALGLALVESGHFDDASSYLTGVVKQDPHDGPVWMGLAEISLAKGDKRQALQLFARALSNEWPPQEEARRRTAQLRYAGLLKDAGRQGESIALLLSIIEQDGDDLVVGKRAADMVKALGTPAQVEQAYAALASRFPADVSVWLKLGDARFAAESDMAALEAYRSAAKADSENAAAGHAVARVEEILRLDPTRRGLAVRERARRWDEILQRVLAAVAACGISPEIVKSGPLLNKRSVSLEATDQKMQAALSIWKAAPASCKTDAVLIHILSKVAE